MNNTLILVISCVNLGLSVLSVVALFMACLAYLKALSLEKATHTVQLMPVDQATSEEPWGMSEKEVNGINEEAKESLEEFSV